MWTPLQGVLAIRLLGTLLYETGSASATSRRLVADSGALKPLLEVCVR